MRETLPRDFGAGPELDLAVICVTWNSAAHLPAFVSSLADGLAPLTWALWVVDNASSDATVEVVRRLAPYAHVVQTGRNAGYAAGVNAGLRAIDGAAGKAVSPPPAVLVVNPDVTLDPGCGVALVEALGTPGTGIAVPVQRDVDGRVHPTLRRAPTVLRALGEALVGGRRAGRAPLLGEMVMEPRAYEEPTRADWATGSVLAISRACLTEVGAWDERFFLYSEETDFALRAAERKFELRLAPAARCRHARGASHESLSLWSLLTVNRVLLFGHRHSRLHTAAFQAALLLGELLRWRRDGGTHRAAVRTLLHPRTSASALIEQLQGGLPPGGSGFPPGRPPPNSSKVDELH